jgi:hypothetical protein
MAVFHMENAVGKRNKAWIVCNTNHSGAFFTGQMAEKLDDLFAMGPVQGAGRLISKEEVRVLDERAANRNALFFAARKL